MHINEALNEAKVYEHFSIFFYFLFKSVAKVELSYVFTIAENARKSELS